MGKKTRRPPAAEPPEDAPLDEPAASEPDASDRVMTQFARNLATGNRKTRAQALGALEKWLQGRGEDGCNRPPDPTSLHRVEVAAMVTFCAKLSAACELVHRFEEKD